MIYSFNVLDKNNTIFPHISKMDLPQINFKSGVNVLIGGNGSGKSTILNTLSQYTFCDLKGYSNLPIEHELYYRVFPPKNKRAFENIEIIANFDISTYKTLIFDEMNKNDIGFDELAFQSLIQERMSQGQKQTNNLVTVCKLTNDSEKIHFKKDVLNYRITNSEGYKMLADYFKKNHKSSEEGEYTILMDEPDRNLDVSNLQYVFNILRGIRKCQIIVALHNPVLIYKLSKLENVNFIELTPNYLKNVINFVTTNTP